MRLPHTGRTLLIVVGLTIASGTLAADLDALKNTTPQERADAQTAMMKTRVGLTEEQTPKVAALNLKYAEKMEPIIKGSNGPLAKLRDAHAVEQQKEAELKELLSADQFHKFLAIKAEMREQFVERMKERRAQGGR